MTSVSIVVPMFNSEAFIGTCISSLLRSTWMDFEILVVDDGSTDNSKKKLHPFLSDARVKLIESPRNQGVATARNLGIEAAGGRYIAFCDSDDIWEPTKLERQVAVMQIENAALSHTSVYYAQSGHRSLIAAKKRVTWEDMKVRNWIPNSSGVYDTQKLGKIFQHPNRHEDYEMWCEALKAGGTSIGLDIPLVTISRREGSVSGNKLKSLIWHVQSQHRIFDMAQGEIILHMIKNIASRLRQKIQNFHRS